MARPRPTPAAAATRRQRAVHVAELTIGLVGFPAVLVWGGGLPGRPTLPSAGELRGALSEPSTLLGSTALRPLFWLGWLLWAYLVVAVALSALGHIGGARAALTVRDRLFPRQFCQLLDVVFVVAVAVGPKAAGPVSASPAAHTVSAPAAPAASPASTTSASHVVVPGETLSSIAAQRCGSPAAWPALFEHNRDQVVGSRGERLADPDLVRPGWRVALPPTCAEPAAGAADVHVVGEGESLWAIAQGAFGDGRRWVDIWELNRGQVVGDAGEVLERPRFIEPGWRLRMPSVGPAATASPPPGASGETAPVPRATAAHPPAAEGLSVPTGDPSPVERRPDVRPAPESASASATPPRKQPPAAAPQAAAPASRSITPPAPPAGEVTDDRDTGAGVRLPGGSVVAWSLGAAALAVVVRARAQRLRRLRRGETHRSIEEPAAAAAVRQAGIPPSADALGPLAERVLEAWTAATGTFPRIEAVWGRRDVDGPGGRRIVASFLLESGAPRRLPAPTKLAGVTVRFECQGDTVWAVASGAELPSIRRGTYAFADGLLTPVGTRDEGALHLPLLGPALAVAGPHASALVEAMVLAAAVRSPQGALRVVVVDDLDVLRDGLPLEGADLPKVERVSGDESASFAETLGAELVSKAGALTAVGADDFCEHAAAHPSDRLGATLLVVPADEVGRWAPVVEQGTGRGLGTIVVGEWASAARRLDGASTGTLTVQLPGREPLAGLVPGCLPAGALRGLVDATMAPAAFAALVPDQHATRAEADVTNGVEASHEGAPAHAEADGSADGRRPEQDLEDQGAGPTAPDTGRIAPPDVVHPVSGAEVGESSRGTDERIPPALDAAGVHESEAPRLRLRLFGTLRLERADGTEVPQPKGGPGVMAGREIFSFLALHRGFVESDTLREKILGMQEVRTLEQQRASIDNGLSYVRSWVKAGLDPELVASLSASELRNYGIVRDPRRGYRLDEEHVWVDVREFEGALAEARVAAHPEPALRRALELYTGDLLTSYGRVGASQREPFLFRDPIQVYLRGEACLAADRLAVILQDKGRADEALRVVQPLLDGPVCELLERRAMAIEGEPAPRGLGDRTRVHRRWQRLRDRLASELGAGVEPEAATLEAYGRIMRSSAA